MIFRILSNDSGTAYLISHRSRYVGNKLQVIISHRQKCTDSTKYQGQIIKFMISITFFFKSSLSLSKSPYSGSSENEQYRLRTGVSKNHLELSSSVQNVISNFLLSPTELDSYRCFPRTKSMNFFITSNRPM